MKKIVILLFVCANFLYSQDFLEPTTVESTPQEDEGTLYQPDDFTESSEMESIDSKIVDKTTEEVIIPTTSEVKEDVTTEVPAINYKELPDDELIKLAENGDTEAQYQLGVYLEGLKYSGNQLRFNSAEQNPFKWYIKAAENDHAKALTRVGKEYLTKFGYFKKLDYTTALNYFKQAANRDRESSILASVILYWGLGVTKDQVSALKLFNSPDNEFYRVKAMIYLEKELIDMVRELSRVDNNNALFILGDLYYFGQTNYYPQDYKKAFRLYTQSAEKGNSSASYMVGIMNYEGTGILKDFRESYIWITKAAEGGCPPAMVKAGIMNYFGEGSDINLEAAYKWLSLAAPGNDSLAQYFLGVMYYKGEGTDKDLKMSKKWIKAAFENGSTSAKKFWDAKELWAIPN